MFKKRKRIITEKEDVINSVRDGSYFKDSVDWVFSKYILPIIDRNILIMLIIFILSINILYILLIIDINPIRKYYPVPITVDSEDRLILLKKIGHNNDLSFQESLARFFALNYVKERESYDFNKIKNNDIKEKANFIKYYSSAKEIDKFNNYFEDLYRKNDYILSNANIINSYFNRQDNSNLKFFDKILYFFNPRNPDEINIIFNKNIYNGKNKITQKYMVNIKFLFQILNDDNDIFYDDKIIFKVNKYEKYKIK